MQQVYKACPYSADVLTALGGQGPPNDDNEIKRWQGLKSTKQFTLEEDGLICQRATGKLGVITSMRGAVLREAHDSPAGGHFGAQRTTAFVRN